MVTVTNTTELEQDRYDRLVKRVQRLLVQLNEVIGGGATWGYLGNCGIHGDDRSWYVFLPHPNRVGTADDRLGGFETGSVAGVEALVTTLHGAVTMARYLTNRR